MPRYLIVSERSRIDVTARPALPGVRLAVDEVSGALDTDDRTASGAITLWLQAILDDAARLDGVPPWLRGGDPVPLEGAIERAAWPDGEHVEVGLRLAIAGRAIPLTGAGRIERHEGTIAAVGVTVVDPRTLGFALPPLVTFTLHTRWRLTLAAA